MKRAHNLETIDRSWTNIGLPQDMSELSFLDVGCWCGGYVKIAEERGAKKAIGLDVVRSPDLHDIDFIHMDIFSEKFLEIERFDIVLSRGVLYHVENPISFLYRLKAKTIQKLVLETLLKNGDEADDPVMLLLPDTSWNTTNWWQPTISCVKNMLKVCEFTDIKQHTLNTYKEGNKQQDIWRGCFSGTPVNSTCRRMLPRGEKYMKD
tara:strand:+ start:5558 stop:6178 length:621 start_codon:yes stop_codon:yes gene_type:complete